MADFIVADMHAWNTKSIRRIVPHMWIELFDKDDNGNYIQIIIYKDEAEAINRFIEKNTRYGKEGE